MMKVQDVVDYLDQLAPPDLAAAGDNVGLLVGDPAAAVTRIMTALTLSEDVAEEALRERASLVIVHHPVIYRPISRIVTSDPVGRVLWRLARGGVSVYSPHSAWDSAMQGINQQWAELLGLGRIGPLDEPRPDGAGRGRYGELPAPQTLAELTDKVKSLLNISRVGVVGDLQSRVQIVGIACGSGAELIPLALRRQCHVLISGEMTYHRCLLARASGLSLLLVGHFASERFAMERLAAMLSQKFPQVSVWCSRQESDPIIWA